MKKLILMASLICLMPIEPALADVEKRHALGDMFATALNMIQTDSMLRHMPVTDIHMDHGQVFIALQGDKGPQTVVYDPIAHRLLTAGKNTGA